MDNSIGFGGSYSIGSDLFAGEPHPTYQQLGPDQPLFLKKVDSDNQWVNHHTVNDSILLKIII